MAKKTQSARKVKYAKTTELDKQVVGNVGMYFVCYRLSELGLNAMPTARNAKGIDVLAYTPDGKECMGIQVKTLSKRNTVPLGKSFWKKPLMGDFWCIVNRGDEPAVFVMTPEQVRAGAKKNKSGGSLCPTAYDNDEFRERWDRIVSFKRNRS